MSMGIPVKLQVFEGPLDLLLHLIDKNKVNIYDIPIVEITNQYLEYIQEMKRQDLNIMSEFLVMAATLIDIKSKMLLPKEVNEELVNIHRGPVFRHLFRYGGYLIHCKGRIFLPVLKLIGHELIELILQKLFYKLLARVGLFSLLIDLLGQEHLGLT